MAITYPYDDEYMEYDEVFHRYYLTQAYVENKMGIPLSAIINERNGVDGAMIVRQFLRTVSDVVYAFIHKHNVDTVAQDYIIAKVPSMRNIMLLALTQQLTYMRMKGDLSRSTDKEKRELYMDQAAETTLGQIMPELGFSILYTGDLRRWILRNF